MKTARKGLLEFVFPRKHSVRWRLVCRQFIGEHSYYYRRKGRKHWAEEKLTCNAGMSAPTSLRIQAALEEYDLGQNVSPTLRKFPAISQQLGRGSWSHIKWKSLSCVWLFVTLWTIQSMEFSRPEYWNGQLFHFPGDLPNPGIEPRSPAL